MEGKFSAHGLICIVFGIQNTWRMSRANWAPYNSRRPCHFVGHTMRQYHFPFPFPDNILAEATNPTIAVEMEHVCAALITAPDFPIICPCVPMDLALLSQRLPEVLHCQSAIWCLSRALSCTAWGESLTLQCRMSLLPPPPPHTHGSFDTSCGGCVLTLCGTGQCTHHGISTPHTLVIFLVLCGGLTTTRPSKSPISAPLGLEERGIVYCGEHPSLIRVSHLLVLPPPSPHPPLEI